MPVYPSGGTIAQSVGSPGFGPAPTPSYNASASVRLNPADTPSFGYVPTLQGNRQTFTFSVWIKRSLLGSIQTLFGVNTDTNNHTFFEFQANDTIRIATNTSTTNTVTLVTTQVFRDPGQWYHIVLTYDLTNSTQADRVRLFINGSRVTALSTNTLPANTTTLTSVNAQGVQHYIGRYAASSSQYFGGYVADMNFVDGLALAPSSFTSTDANTGQLVPVQYTGDFGINGFYLPLNSAALAADLGQNKKVINQDAYWPYNTLLVNTTSTNGQQNNDFVNDSQFAVSVPMTRVGNTTQGNFSPFAFGGGTTQADGYYSGYFDGNGDYLSVASNAALAFGTGDFTMETYIYPLSLATDTLICGVDVTNGVLLGYSTTTVWLGSRTVAYDLTATYTLPLNTWTHLAVSRQGTTARIFANGIQIASGTVTKNYPQGQFVVGNYATTNIGVNGYLSNVRIVKGTAVYTANFTVPTTPLTAVTNTQLLTCQSSQFIDNSANAFAITVVGNSQPVPANPFGMTAWSGYFDGAGDYLTLASSAGLAMETGNFTWELWINQQSSTGFRQFIDTRTGSGNLGLFFGTNTGTTNLYVSNDTTVLITASASFDLNQWHHVALVRSSGTLTLYLNGVSVGTASYSANMTNTTGTIAGVSGGNQYAGYISNVRMVKGTAVYTANFTPPTAPLTAISGTSLLTCQSSTFVDSSPNAVAITTNGNPYTLTLNNPFGSPINYTTPPVQAWSTYHAASGDTLSLSQTALTALSSSNAWTIEFWAYKAASSAVTYSTVLSTDISGNSNGTVFSFNNTTFACGGQGHAGFPILYTPVGTTSLNQWYHFAIVKNNGVLKIYINGIERASSTQSTTFPNISQPLRIGNRNNGDTPFIGYVSNIRFVNGRAVYTSNFTPPTSPLSVIGNTTLLTCQSNRLVDNSFNNFVITKAGNVNVSPVTPFFPIQTYSAASNGGAMYFDGTGDYLNIIKSSFLAGTQDFTFQAWIYPTSTNSGTVCGFGANTPTGYCGLNWRITSTTMQTYWSTNGSSETLISGGAIKQNVWQHVAATRSGSTIRLFLDGVQVGTGTVSGALYTGSVADGALNSYTIGCYFSSSAPAVLFTGYISSFEYLNGVSRYNTSFTPPVLPQTAANLTTVLLNATNSGIYNATGENVIETAGNAQVSTAVKKWGTSSVFFDGSGDYLVIPPTNAPCQFGTTDFTIEAWIYSTSIANQQIILSNRIAATGTANFDFQIVTSKLLFGTTNTNLLTGTITLSSNTWYHVAVSRVSGTARMFVNGVLDTSTTTSFNLSNNSVTHVGTNGTYAPTQYPFIGYMQDLRVSKVGRYSSPFTPPTAAFAYNVQDICYQQWGPTNISVTAGVGQDNLVDSPSDYGTDTGLGGQVRGNYATWNPLKNSTTLSNGNLSSFNSSTTQWLGVAGTFGVTSGKWYWECTPTTAAASVIGLSNSFYNTGGHPGWDANSWGYYNANGNKYFNAAASAYGASYTANDVIGVAFDADVGTLTFYKNGVSQGVAFSGLTSGPYFPACGVLSSQNTNINAGQRAFAYAAPTGFKCLVSTNLPTVNGIGATSTTRASNYFNANLWTGNGTQIPAGFDPSLIWYKSTNAVGFGGWIDQIRGDDYYMQTWDTVGSTLSSGLLTTNSTGFVPGSAFSTNTYIGYSWKGADTLSWSFDGSLERTATMTIASPCVVTLASNGFSAGQAVRFTTTGALPTGIVAGTTYYAGNIVTSTFNLYDTEANAIAGGATGRVDTSGSQSGTQTCEHAARISANPTSGFSVTQYIGTGATTTIPHGLGAAPELYFIKCSGSAGNWYAFTTSVDGSVDFGYLNTVALFGNAGAGFSTPPTSSVVSIGVDATANTNGVTYMLYSYASVPGYSKVGVYIGNGTSDGPAVYTGFEPKFLMTKRVAGIAGTTDSWFNMDDQRNPNNVVNVFLSANTNAAQDGASSLDFLSNGFKIRVATIRFNQNASTYLYLAVASAPFKYSRAY